MRSIHKEKLVASIILLLISIIIAIGICGLVMKKHSNNNYEIKIVKNNIENYVAYIKINSYVKLNYSYTCTVYSDGYEICQEPKVNNYEFVNDYAKEIFKNINLLQNNSNLNDVIKLICKNSIENNESINNIKIISDWNKLNDYLKNNIKNDDNYTFSIDVKDKITISNIINSDKEFEQKNRR